MKRQKNEELRQWHPAFFAGIQIELEEESANLVFENEHQLGTKPKEIDVLIVKKQKDVSIKKNIGRIFRKYNIIEYKSPNDYLSIDDFYKVYGYACFYKSDTIRTDQISVEELTITFVCGKYPRKLMQHLRKVQGLHIDRQDEGIYYMEGDVIPMQLILTSELDEEQNLWLRSLTNQLTEPRTIEKLIREYGRHSENRLYESMMNIIVKANQRTFQEVSTVCEALEELMKDRIEERVEERVEERIEEREQKALEKGIKAFVQTCKELGIPKSEMQPHMEEKFKLSHEAAEQYIEEYWI